MDQNLKEILKRYIGKMWKEVPEDIHNRLLGHIAAVDGRTGNAPTESMNCIVDFSDTTISCTGYYDDEENRIEIDKNGIIYDPTE